MERLLAGCPPADLETFVADTLGPLLAYDRTQEGELVATLTGWVETRSVAQTARRVYAHYNTVRKRWSASRRSWAPCSLTPTASSTLPSPSVSSSGRRPGVESEATPRGTSAAENAPIQLVIPSYTSSMKIAVSIPDPLFEAAEQVARRLGLSRSQLYARAIERFLADDPDDEVTARLDEVYASQASSLDPGFARAQRRAVAGPS